MGARHLRDANPRYALVLWPDATARNEDPEVPCCIRLCGLEDAVAFGAVVVAREDGDFCHPREPQAVDEDVLKHLKRHPYRRDADWRSDSDDGA